MDELRIIISADKNKNVKYGFYSIINDLNLS